MGDTTPPPGPWPCQLEHRGPTGWPGSSPNPALTCCRTFSVNTSCSREISTTFPSICLWGKMPCQSEGWGVGARPPEPSPPRGSRTGEQGHRSDHSATISVECGSRAHKTLILEPRLSPWNLRTQQENTGSHQPVGEITRAWSQGTCCILGGYCTHQGSEYCAYATQPDPRRHGLEMALEPGSATQGLANGWLPLLVLFQLGPQSQGGPLHLMAPAHSCTLTALRQIGCSSPRRDAGSPAQTVRNQGAHRARLSQCLHGLTHARDRSV